MFFNVSVILFVGVGCVASQHAFQVVSQHALQVSRPTPKGGLQVHTWGGLQAHTWRVPAPGGFAPREGSAPRGVLRPPHDGYCCRRYVSYWNAFLLINHFILKKPGTSKAVSDQTAEDPHSLYYFLNEPKLENIQHKTMIIIASLS